ncbi:hypothetical protein R1flu_028498 [Riccia fluitans]|uniref:Uncharacterized protein n=1 Tax=Riccia fluitans TaxID=41844 RepID=A0ABD1XMD9_9MARC
MRREGRVHGSCIRMRKEDELEYNKRPPRKPTNHSRMTGACLTNRRHCLGCHYYPVEKAMSKTKGKHKLKDQDITKNHRWNDFAFGCYPPRLTLPSPALRDLHYGDDLRFAYDSDLTDYHSEEEEVEEIITRVEEPKDETLGGGVRVESALQIAVESGSDGSDSELGGVDEDGWYLVG